MKRTAITLLASAIVLTVGSSHVLAQDEEGGFEFGDEESTDEQAGDVTDDATPVIADTSNDPSDTSQVNRFLQEGIQYFNNEDYVSASIFFWRVVSDPDPAADGLRPRAQYELAKTLVKMRLLQGALYFFDEIIATGPSHPYFEPSAPWLILIARRLPGDVNMLRRVAAFESVFPDRIEEKYRDEMAYMLGQHYYNVGELENSLLFLELVSTVSEYYAQSMFLQGITYIRDYEADPAIMVFEDLLDFARSDRTRDEDLASLAELAQLTLARTHYSTGQYEDAIREYQRIEQESSYWLDALFESSWAHFQLDEFNRALGNLHSLNSPFFSDEYYPEAPILQAVTFFYNCRFDEVRNTLEEFDYIYPLVREDLEFVLEDLWTNEEYFDFVVNAQESNEEEYDPRLSQILDATLSDRSIQNNIAYVQEIDREILYVETAETGWAGSELADYLFGALWDTRDESVSEAGELVASRLDAILDDLRLREREASAILIETDLSEADVMGSDVAEEFFTGESGETFVQAGPQDMHWQFDGEYWRDELGYYFYYVTSVCQEEM